MKPVYLKNKLPSLVLLLAVVIAHLTGFEWLHLPLAAAMVAVPGYLLVRSFKIAAAPMLQAALSAVMGTAAIMAIGLINASILPLVGIDRPLAFTPLLITYTLALATLTVFASRDKTPFVFKKPKHISALAASSYGACAILPLLSFIGANLLNNGYGNAITLTMFGLAAALIGATITLAKKLPRSVFPAVLFAVGLSALWSYSLRSSFVFGWDIQQEFVAFQQTHAAGQWDLGAVHSAYDAMLSLTVLPSALSTISGLSGTVLFKVFYPILFSFLPVILYYTYRIFVKRWIAFAAAALTIGQFYYMQQFSALARQQIAFLFFATIFYSLLSDKLSGNTKRWLVGSSIFGLIVSHYSTTYTSITLIGITWVLAKIVAGIRRDQLSKAIKVSGYLPWWLIGGLVGGAILWYGPATHSSGTLRVTMEEQNFSKVVDVVADQLSANTKPVERSDEYLDKIGPHYKSEFPDYTYYSDGDNSTTQHVAPATIQANGILSPLAKIMDIALRYGIWLIGFAAIIVFLVEVSARQFDRRRTELGVLATVAIVLFTAIHLMPGLGDFYNASRMNQQMLLFVALPAILGTIWLFDRYAKNLSKAVVGATVIAAFLLAGGIVNQIAGGTPYGNLNNFGGDYQRFYMHQTDIAATAWLGKTYDGISPIFSDRYATLHFTVPTTIRQGFMQDITPETLAKGAYVYGDHTNISDGVAMSLYGGETVQYEFPKEFILNRKSTLYSNGNAEIYR